MLEIVDRIENIAIQCLREALDLDNKFEILYDEYFALEPIYTNAIEDMLRDKNMLEIVHSRILYGILRHNVIANSFVKYFFPSLVTDNSLINILQPDHKRIDLSIKCNNSFIIIESKVNNAKEQETQVDRYIDIARNNYADENIYVLYLNRDNNLLPSEKSLSDEHLEMLGERFVCRNYKNDIIEWLESLLPIVHMNEEPYLKSTILLYLNYLKTIFDNNSRLDNMNKKIEKELVNVLGLNELSLEEKVDLINDKLDSIEKLKESLEALHSDYMDELDKQRMNSWFKQITESLRNKIKIKRDTYEEFGFEFLYHRIKFMCVVSFDDTNYYWGIKGVNATSDTKPTAFTQLKSLILNSNIGLCHDSTCSSEWVISDYEDYDRIVETYLSLARFILNNEECVILN